MSCTATHPRLTWSPASESESGHCRQVMSGQWTPSVEARVSRSRVHRNLARKMLPLAIALLLNFACGVTCSHISGESLPLSVERVRARIRQLERPAPGCFHSNVRVCVKCQLGDAVYPFVTAREPIWYSEGASHALVFFARLCVYSTDKQTLSPHQMPRTTSRTGC